MTEAVISSSILIAIMILIRMLFKGKLRSSVRYALWLIAAARLMLPFGLLQSPISVMNAAETVISVNQADESVQPTEAELYIPESVAEQTLNEASPMNVEKASPKEVWTAVRRKPSEHSTKTPVSFMLEQKMQCCSFWTARGKAIPPRQGIRPIRKRTPH